MDHPAIETLARALAGLDSDACVKLVEEVGRAMGPERLLEEVYLPALSKVGDIWARGLLDDLAFAQAAVVAEQLWGLVAPGAAAKTCAGPTVLVAVLAPDRHDIGKNQVSRLLTEAGARVTDLGIQVEPSDIAARAKEVGARAVLVGASTRDALARLGEVREALDEAGVNARLVVGGQAVLGGPFPDGVDAVSTDAYEAVEHALSGLIVAAGGAASSSSTEAASEQSGD